MAIKSVNKSQMGLPHASCKAPLLLAVAFVVAAILSLYCMIIAPRFLRNRSMSGSKISKTKDYLLILVGAGTFLILFIFEMLILFDYVEFWW